MRIFRGFLPFSVLLILVAANVGYAEKGDDEKGCLDCHPKFFKEREGEFNHQPFGDKNCEVCHIFHQFKQQMVMSGELFDNCTQCHEQLFMLPEDELHYPVLEDEGCMSCHEPHSADNKKLLVRPSPLICLECHEDEPGEDDVVHPPFEDSECTGCHDPHGTEFTANLLLPTYFVCLECHEDLLGEMDYSQLHSGDGIRSCENCHVGHYGSEPHLLRDAVPGLTLRTTVIVGFPGETDDDFREMLELLEEMRFERVGAFTYSVEEGTRAAEMTEQVPDDIMEERMEEVMELQRVISFERNEELVGQTMEVLIDAEVEDDPDFVAVGRTVGQAADVDGVTHIRGPVTLRPGDLVQGRIVEGTDYDLVAEVDAGT